MDNKVIGLIGFVLGGVVGAVVTYFAVQNKFDLRLEKEIAEFKAGYVTEMDISDKKEESASNIGKVTEDESTKPSDIPQSVIDAAARMRVVTRSDSTGAGAENGTNEKTNYNKTVVEEGYAMAEETVKKPYVITVDDYYNPIGKMAEYKRVKLYYDTENGECYDEEGEYVDTDEMVGYFNLTGISEGNQDTIFVCNESLETLFDIVSDDPTM